MTPSTPDPAPKHTEGFYLVGGAIAANAHAYVERIADHDLLHAILDHQYCTILTARQLGKSSLLHRTISRLSSSEFYVAVIDLQAGVGTRDQFYAALCTEIAQACLLPIALDGFLAARQTLPRERIFQEFLGDVLAAIEGKSLIVAVDEIDMLRSAEFCDDFFAVVRACYNRRPQDANFRRLVILLVGAVPPDELARDPRKSPFNIGRQIELGNLERSRAESVLSAGLPWNTLTCARVFARIWHWTNGHPYLTQRLCQELSKKSIEHTTADTEVDYTVALLFFGDHATDAQLFAYIKNFINSLLPHVRSQFIDAYYYILCRDVQSATVEPQIKLRLLISGLVQNAKSGALECSNRIFATVFDEQWVQKQRDQLPSGRSGRARFYEWLRHLFFRKTPQSRDMASTRIRGLSPYSELDGHLFSQLGRQREIDSCIDTLTSEGTSLVIVIGQSGSGKTSFLRAGLQYTLLASLPKNKMNEPLRCVYWSAGSIDPSFALANIIETATGIPCNGNPATLLRSSYGPLILIIDQFERLNRHSPQHAPIFELIHGVCRQSPPHALQLVIAFGVNYLPEWLDFQDELPIQAKKILLGGFSMETARISMQKILDDARIRVDPIVVEKYIREVADQEHVSPVSIALGVLAFSTWSESARKVQLQDYAMIGGTAAVLRAHVASHLSAAYVAPRDRDPLLRALIDTLIESDTGRRRVEGASDAAIARIANLDYRKVNIYLRDLEAARIIERISEPNIYILTHDQLVSVLNDIAHNITELERSILDRYLLWKRRSAPSYLLRGRQLAWALAHSTALISGTDAIDRARYLTLSSQARRRRILGTGILVLLLIAASVLGFHVTRVSQLRTELAAAHLPPDLYDRQVQFETLVLKDISLKDLNWLHSPSLANLTIDSTNLHSLDGIAGANNLISLELRVGNMRQDNFQAISSLHRLRTLTLYDVGRARSLAPLDLSAFQELNTLNLDLSGSPSAILPDLTVLRSLSSLSLNLRFSAISDLTLLARMPNLRHVRLLLDRSRVHSLLPLASLDKLETLAVDLDPTQTDLLAALNIAGLRSLTVSCSASDVRQLSILERFKQLDELNLIIRTSELQKLPDISQLRKLRSLTLDLRASALVQLPNIDELRNLEQLTLDLSFTNITHLPQFERRNTITDLKLLLRGSKIHSIRSIKRLDNLKSLALDIKGTKIADLDFIASINGLERLVLYLTSSQMEDLAFLSRLVNVHSIELHVSSPGSIKSLPDFSNLSNLSSLELYLEGSEIQHIPSEVFPSHLQNLTLDLSQSHIMDISSLKGVKHLETLSLDLQQTDFTSFPDLAFLEGLHQVTADIRRSKIKDLRSLQTLDSLQELTLDNNIQSLAGLPISVKRLIFTTHSY